MPQIPKFTQRVEESVGPVQRIESAAVAPSGETQLLGQIAKVGVEIYKQERDYADQIAVMEADKKLSALETQLLYNPESGAMNKKGKDAFAVIEPTDEAFQKGISEIESGLSNERQMAAFKRLAYGRQGDISRSLNKHVAQERQRYEIQETEAYIQTERTAVIQNPYDLERIDMAIERQKMAILAMSERNGLPPEVTQKSLQEVSSKTHRAAIEQMLAEGSDRAADQYFKSVSNQISGDDKTYLTKNLEVATLAGESQRKANDLFTSAKSYGDALEQARKIEDSKLQDATISRIKELQNQKDEVERDQKEKLNVNFANMIDQGQDPRGKPGWADLTTNERTNLENYYKHRLSGTEPRTNWANYYDLKTMASNPATRDQFSKIDLFSEYRSNLGDTEFKELVSLQTGVRNGSGETKSLLDGYRTDKSIVDDALMGMGIDIGSKANDSENEKAAAFRRMVDEAIIAQQQATGKKVNNNDIQTIVDNMTVKVVTDKGLFWDTKKPFTLLDEDDQIEDIDVSDIPKAEKLKIQDVLKRKGLPDSDTAIVDLYLRKLKSMRNK